MAAKMFFGEFEHSLDAKGRLIIPAKFRELLGPNFVITRGMDGCIFGYPPARWSTLQAQLDALPLTKKDARAFVRFFYSAAAECELDKQGRIMIPASLRQYADLAKKCVIVGVSDRFEIWSADKWQAFEAETTTNFDDLAENLIDF
ncbi:Protein mraZ [Lactobacillus plantarum subsp. plantarum P-8] [Lactiplantibacillus mudanjiangensis]|uniref:Transcriptional regulator MraZ n=2 Tax=Lactiplantibacillus mudanjiangensis TaxID=1296538 RepID=A0A660E410_9LACO|nr:Protein mraZ [Lactobacillus plantarum subsp. plantarum P-8] [Lactiplantibacillus mudanjiangensis]VDG30059.1 Protein mraZ [Lactobacillus plantarum subsp. plantarum P-8] [Lactiplantibacillus mudanjiangensis]VDG30546.1 Protein mraZ [Lactobacillus plantarum subsp. plantarum P-8] [Lactiplantibacillus mudanjiangensis]